MTGIASGLCVCGPTTNITITFLLSAIAIEGGVFGSLVYTSVFGGLVWGGLYLSDPVRRVGLWSSLKERQGLSFTGVRDKALAAVRDRAVSATNATLAAVKAKYNEIRTRISEASKKGSEK